MPSPTITRSDLHNSRLLRVLLIGFLILLLQFAISMIQGVIVERQSTRIQAVDEVTASWGRRQAVVGPKLVVPYVTRSYAKNADGDTIEHTHPRHAVFLPERLSIAGDVDGERRYRGIFEIPLYQASLEITGRYARPDFSQWNVAMDDIQWDRAHLVVGITDSRAIQELATLHWADAELEFLPGRGGLEPAAPGIHALVGALADADSVPFSFSLVLNGSGGLHFTPVAKETVVELASDWPDPSFRGSWLPRQRSVDESGFQAQWGIPNLGRSYPQQWNSEAMPEGALERSLFGVDFIVPVDHYRMAERSIKYATLFLFLTFGALWLFEVLAGVRIHSLHFLLVGSAMCLFYLLELALSEHIGFVLAYALAAASVVVTVGLYALRVLRGARRAVVISAVLTSLYGYLYVVLDSQDYALLVGSLGLFVGLALVMYLTRNVDWFGAVDDPGASSTEGVDVTPAAG